MQTVHDALVFVFYLVSNSALYFPSFETNVQIPKTSVVYDVSYQTFSFATIQATKSPGQDSADSA